MGAGGGVEAAKGTEGSGVDFLLNEVFLGTVYCFTFLNGTRTSTGGGNAHWQNALDFKTKKPKNPYSEIKGRARFSSSKS